MKRNALGLREISGKSLLKIAPKVKVLTLIVQGRRDVVVDYKGAKELYKRLKTRKAILIYEYANHGLYSTFNISEELAGMDECCWKVLEDIAKWILEG